jgi:hypothetical protein
VPRDLTDYAGTYTNVLAGQKLACASQISKKRLLLWNSTNMTPSRDGFPEMIAREGAGLRIMPISIFETILLGRPE